MQLTDANQIDLGHIYMRTIRLDTELAQVGTQQPPDPVLVAAQASSTATEVSREVARTRFPFGLVTPSYLVPSFKQTKTLIEQLPASRGRLSLIRVVQRFEDGQGRGYILVQENLTGVLSGNSRLVMDTLHRLSRTYIGPLQAAIVWLGTGPSNVPSDNHLARQVVQLSWERGPLWLNVAGPTSLLADLHKVADSVA